MFIRCNRPVRARKKLDEEPIATANGRSLTVKVDSEGRKYTSRTIDRNSHIMGDGSINYCSEALEEASRRGISYHRIKFKNEDLYQHITHDRLMTEGTAPLKATYPQKGIHHRKWDEGKQPTPTNENLPPVSTSQESGE